MIADGVDLILWALLAAALLLLASWWTFRSYRRWAKRARGPVSHALPLGAGTLLDEGFTSDRSGLLALLKNPDAYAARAESAAMAGRSLDLMYYIWRLDTTGWLLLAEVVKAADRGVRVRLLLDDVNVQGFDRTFLALNQHPRIEVRLFNPTRSRGHAIRRTVEMLLGIARFNRRMHGKMWIADGRIAVLGGRNIGDTYFGALGSGVRNSHDIDVAAIGPVVQDAERSFDDYWNLGLSLPILTLWPKFTVSSAAFRRRIARHVTRIEARDFIGRKLPEGVLSRRFHFTNQIELIADPPDKAYGRRSAPWLVDRLPDILGAAERDLRLITPYFVPGNEGMEVLTDLAGRGARVEMLTNALCTTDMLVVHGAYGRYRLPLLKAGVRMFEYGPIPRRDGRRDLLHTKLFLIDGKRALIGSVNYDLRSAYMNTELGLLFEQPEVVAELMAEFDAHIAPEAAYALELHEGRHRFRVRRAGLPEVMDRDPEAPPILRAVSWIAGHLPIQSYL
ncbi:phospholipase D-like domain-containing protein [Falsirhodobacter xinxiangensis]|uniref:phospholipase D-like domain-containing protein n=1 Tax=Falsirhodobacter xinxiangensis TaxID=2530049 RepID=UPI0010A9A7A7|nr:phospholipase D family protein [Rhodobacter xinxiangensis]